MKTRKAQTANPQQYISLLIFVIGLTLIVYITALPPEDRAELLEQNRTTVGDGEKDDITILLTREPGTITNIPELEIINDLPSFNLFVRTDATVLLEFDSIFVKKSLFEEQSRNLSFSVSNFENTDNLVLSFSMPKHEGRLTILLNDIIIHENEVSTSSPSPIKLPKDLLKKENTLLFKVSGPGIEFWKTNEYIIDDLKITADVTDTSGHENKQIVYITQQQYETLESFELSFVVDCKATDVAPLEVYLDKRLIYSSIPDCDSKIEVPPVDGKRLRQGENDILFRTTKGNYMLYSIEAKLNLREPIFTTYYFNLDQETYDKIEQDLSDVNVTLFFTNDEDRKQGYFHINGAKFEIDTYEDSYTRGIDEFVRKGNNAVEVKPKGEKIDVLELQIVMAE
ncbi:hypothetical protein JXC34_01325 [Candidatus Woesearchaeota archaeon]|nr:hypothetical protein [Candidatus Woesearchaeota archaeon]